MPSRVHLDHICSSIDELVVVQIDVTLSLLVKRCKGGIGALQEQSKSNELCEVHGAIPFWVVGIEQRLEGWCIQPVPYSRDRKKSSGWEALPGPEGMPEPWARCIWRSMTGCT